MRPPPAQPPLWGPGGGFTSRAHGGVASVVATPPARRVLSVFLAIVLAAGLVPVVPMLAEPDPAYAEGAANSTVTITHRPVGGTFALGATTRLYVQASSSSGGLLTYQWYRNTTNVASGGDPVGDGSSICDDVPDQAGVYYYYVVVSDAGGATATSNVAQVVVEPDSLPAELTNGDFETEPSSGTPQDSSWYMWEEYPSWDTTHWGEGSTTGAFYHKKSIQASAPEKLLNASQDAKYGRHSAELCADSLSALYQEVATVPGKLFPWSLDHAATYTANVSGDDVMAVVIGPALTDEESSGLGYAPAATYSTDYPYGKNDKGYFNKIVDALAKQEGVSSASKLASGRSYSLQYDHDNDPSTPAKPYYIYISSSHIYKNTTPQWNHRSGVYTVPEGQGVTVFGFVALSAASGSSARGNTLDNITFKQGEGVVISSDVDYAGGGVLSVDVSDESYRYGLLEVRGSTAFAAQGAKATQGTAVLTADENGWYMPADAGGTITFSNLTPGKTYRVVAIPAEAINEKLNVNRTPAVVLDESYYRQVTVKAVSDGSNGSGGNIQATAEITEGGHARIIVKPARDDVQYALLETDGSRNPLPDKPVYSWAPPVEGAGSLAFDGLSREVSYAIVARAKDYDEVTYQGQVDAKAFVVVKTPSADFRDVAVGDGSVVRSVDGQTITITNKSPRSQYYMIYDAKTGVAVTDSLHPDGWREFEGNGSGEKPVSVSVDASTAYQIVAKELSAAPSPGIRSYGLAPTPEIDYVDETVGKDGFVPKTVEYKTKDNDASNPDPWFAGGEDVWVAGSGGSALPLADVLDEAALGATLTYRVKADYEPSIAIESTCEIKPRTAAPQQGVGYTIDYESETVSAGSSNAALEVKASSSSSWIAGASGNAISFARLGWTGAASSIDVRTAAVATEGFEAFASRIAQNIVLAARPAVPAAGAGGVTLTQKDEGTATLSGVGADLEYRLDATSAWVQGSDAGVQDVSVAAGSSLFVRVKATDTAPASLALEVSPSSLYVSTTGSFASSLTYGYDSDAANGAAATLSIKNSSETGALKVSKVSLVPNSGFKLRAKDAAELLDEVVFDPAHELAVGDEHGDVLVVPQTSLSAGSHEVKVTVTYTDTSGSATFSAITTLVLSVLKASQDPPTELKATGQSSEALSLQALAPSSGSTSGVMEFSRTGGSTWIDRVNVASGSAATVFTGLSPATAYAISVRMAGDDNHEASAGCAPVAYATAHETPRGVPDASPTESDYSIDFHAETLTFGSAFEACTDTSDTVGSAYESASSLAPLLVDSGSRLYLRHRETTTTAPAAAGGGDVVVPASAWLEKVLQRPSILNDTHSEGADDSKTANGYLEVVGASSFQYRLKGAKDWITVPGSRMEGLAAGTYEVRTPATNTAFASKPIEASIEAKNVYVTFDLGYEGVTPPVEQKIGSGESAARPSDPVRAGYTFGGWYAAGADMADPDAAWNFATEKPTADVTLVAAWTAHAYTVVFHANAPTGCTASGEMNPQSRTFDDAAALSENAFTIPNWEFSGWNTEAAGGGVSYDDKAAGNLTDQNAAVELFAQWKRPAINVDVPVNVAVSVSPDGTFTCPKAWSEENPDGYCIKSATKGALRVSSIGFSMVAGADRIFSKADELSIVVNDASITQGSNPVGVTGEKFKLAASPDGVTAVRLPLALNLEYPGGTITYDKEPRDLATLVYTLEFDDDASGSGA